jgi:tetratricopeptide (TPR) repeat protein
VRTPLRLQDLTPPLPAALGLLVGALLVAGALVGASLVSVPAPKPPPSAAPTEAMTPVQTPVPQPRPPTDLGAAAVIEGYVEAALAYKQRGQMDRAIGLLEDVLRQYPEETGRAALRAHYVLAWACQQKGRKAEALREFRTVLRLAPQGSVEQREAEWGIRLLSRGMR